MLGDKLGELSGQVIGMRVLPSDGAPKMEVSFQAKGRLLGVETAEHGTYVSVLRPDGTLYGEGQGVSMGVGGQGATWKGTGVGVMKEGGAISYRGSIYYSTASEEWARLNRVAAVYEYEVDAEGNASAVTWEWS